MSRYTTAIREVDGVIPAYILHCYRDGELQRMSLHFTRWGARFSSWLWRTSK